MTAALFLALQLRIVAPGVPTPSPTDRWLGADKAKHFLLAGFLQGAGYVALRSIDLRHGDAQAGAFALTISMAIQKERVDRRAYGRFSVRDLAWSAAGALVAAGVLSRTAR